MVSMPELNDAAARYARGGVSEVEPEQDYNSKVVDTKDTQL